MSITSILVHAPLRKPIIWDASRWMIDKVLGIYKYRIQALNDFGVLKNGPSILDVGCGTGHYSKITGGKYIGLDLDEDYIKYATKKYPNPKNVFYCLNVDDLELAEKVDLVILVDILHHLSDDSCLKLLKKLKSLSRKYVAVFEPTLEQRNAFGRWLIRNDRGDYIRKENDYSSLVESSGLKIGKRLKIRHGKLSDSLALLCEV